MSDALNLAVLTCAALAAMLFGVLSSYAIFRVGFWLMAPEVRPSIIKANANTATTA